MTAPRKPRRPGDDYEVGYARPPVATRFQPGQSGNPKGRTKGVKNAATTLREALLAKVTVQEKGRPKVMTKLELALHNAANAAARGDLRALRVLYDLAGRGGDPLDVPAAASDHLPPEDTEIMQRVLARYAASAVSAASSRSADSPEAAAPATDDGHDRKEG